MKSLQSAFETAMQSDAVLQQLSAAIISKRIEAMGVHLTDVQRKAVRDQLAREQKGFTLSIEDDQLTPELIAKRSPDGTLSIDVSEGENLEEELLREYSNHVAELVPKVISNLSPQVREDLKETTAHMLRGRRKDQRLFESGLARRWGKALDLLETMIHIALEAGSSYNNENRLLASQNNDYVFEVLIRLQARACQVAAEVLRLLKSGYADGAMARWRCLHEIAVVAFFVTEHGNGTAERFLLYDAVDSYKAGIQYQEHCEKLGYEPFDEEEMDGLKRRRDAAVARFGNDYEKEYGWAAGALKQKHVTFRAIETAVRFDHFRPFYKLASHNVHAGSKSMFFRLGLSQSGPDLLLAGSSDSGLADPGQCTAISLSQITIALLTKEPTIDNLVMCKVLQQIRDEATDAFIETTT
jgi:hypothetical protein